MKVIIEFECYNDAFVGDDDWEQDCIDTFYTEVGNVLEQAREKIVEQRRREDGCVCTALESADNLLDSNGNTIGTVKVV